MNMLQETNVHKNVHIKNKIVTVNVIRMDTETNIHVPVDHRKVTVTDDVIVPCERVQEINLHIFNFKCSSRKYDEILNLVWFSH